MPSLLWSTALLAGLLGSTHCLGMCGGISAGLGAFRGDKVSRQALPRAWWALLYNVGRLLSYTAFGTVAGALGATGFTLGATRGNAYLRLSTATVIILMGLNMASGGSAGARWLRAPERWGGRLWRHLHPLLARRIPDSPIPRALAIGALWGWLPCGLVYSALLGAAVAGSAGGGAATMLAFGAGTIPAMTGLSFLTNHLPRWSGPRSRAMGVAIIGCGLWTALLPAATLFQTQAHCEAPPTPVRAGVAEH